MSDALFSGLELDQSHTARVGYRLQRVEVYNWGTFDRFVWRLAPGGDTSLLTGDIGSGKSTLVDAITTLLLPAHKISYNKAAGADTKERSLRSYVQGHYRSERSEATGTSRPIGLRDHNTYSVILGVFANEGYHETVTIAQVFHQKDRTGQPDRFFVTADRELAIDPDLSGFGSDLKQLRANLRTRGAQIDASYTDYARKMRRLLGITSQQALELFHQTVSMKSVGNLNEFVRKHMLEPVDAKPKIRSVVDHFEDLHRAHQSLEKATEQLALLTPLMEASQRFETARDTHAQATQERELAGLFIAETTCQLCEQLHHEVLEQLHSAQATQQHITTEREALSTERVKLHAERAGAGGDRLAALEQELRDTKHALRERTQRRTRFDRLLADGELERVATAEQFRERKQQLRTQRLSIDTARAEADRERFTHLERAAQVRRERTSIDEELTSLRERKNNLPRALVRVRQELCVALGVAEEELPFAGELLDIAPTHQRWRGAAERVLRPFAITLLVPHAHAQRVAQWVNRAHLGTRLVYLRVPERQLEVRPGTRHQELTLADILAVEEGRFSPFLRSELARRADVLLVEDANQLQRYDRTVTLSGLMRDRDRHEKDDRHRIDDPRRWVLGRSTETKIRVLETEREALTVQLGETEAGIAHVESQIQRYDRQREAFTRLEEYPNWDIVNVDGAQSTLARLEEEHRGILAGSQRLAQIDAQLRTLESQDEELETKHTAVTERIGGMNAELERLDARHTRERRTIAEAGETTRSRLETNREALRHRMGKRDPRTLDEVADVAASLTREITRVIDQKQREMNGHTTHIVNHMHELLRRWPELASDMDPSIEAIPDFQAMHERVTNDDLPKFEEEFRRLLNTETLRELASLNNWLHRQAQAITGRVETINEALSAIDYNPGRIIALTNDHTVNAEIREFRSDLRDATGDLIGEAEDASVRFERVRQIIERLQGRPGRSDQDKLWMERVTDVRNWFTFAAVERSRDTGEVFEHYTDSDGKSGGQKEKLAYTILAASLAYQFGLEWGVTHSQDFRFVVIDEAFGRGSDASTRYALELFKKLGLQLLIVTPLQKVHIIEPYVRSIGFVDNPTGAASRVHTLTVEEFQELRRDHT